MASASRSGALALVGSGEYLPQMEGTDRLLLGHLGLPSPRVVVLPTAAGLEPLASPHRWARMGIEHFARLGAQVESVDILRREDAFDPRWLPLLEGADFIYFSGGSPLHLIQTLEHSPAWDVIRARHGAGAALAGCSAGAMAFGGYTLQPRDLWGEGPRGSQSQAAAPTWHPALGLVARLIVLPHFDRMAHRMGRDTLASVAAAVPTGVTLVGVDEDTALVRLAGPPNSSDPSVWQVTGRQGVTVFHPDRSRSRSMPGATITLEAGGASEPD